MAAYMLLGTIVLFLCACAWNYWLYKLIHTQKEESVLKPVLIMAAAAVGIVLAVKSLFFG